MLYYIFDFVLPPGMLNGKLAGEPFIHSNKDFKCALFAQASRPTVCGRLTFCLEMCGSNRAQAIDYLTQLEQLTSA
ncbi:YkgJ family cysteine cluster protein [Gilliamella intestini]|uniref:YkgJ family cysteine cluster protein n=1 Tax=Gilliamella intestini TaxID=1798183 RepID=UPI001ADFE547|nr:YkgJ family cysteine cluster protein [Gilliamella intestini]